METVDIDVEAWAKEIAVVQKQLVGDREPDKIKEFCNAYVEEMKFSAKELEKLRTAANNHGITISEMKSMLASELEKELAAFDARNLILGP